MIDALTPTSAMLSTLSQVQRLLILHVPTSDASMAADALVKKSVSDMEQGHRDPGTLTDAAMALGRVEALAEQHLPQRHPLFDALRNAEMTMWEMLRTAA
ncbi:hypothetical protein [Methylorubrum salsuginis]|uniref:Uncharacterized protein n=1 Tax=Methylorubrum salsuginis TaxID=414703 RepID=A0A1I4MI91_9HYPH|nr:hypothetical protein [Methylorubrum salsuginis]SFM02795.1 hypothetical protein SAMN04488125_1398 [Methylorubrum salsuginis]